jgi:hypothetical protein
MILTKKYTAFLLLLCGILIAGCNTPKAEKKSVQRKKHWIEIGLKGEGMMYLDGVPNAAVMQENKNDSSGTEFCSFLVGFQDSSMAVDAKKQEEKQKYFQYEMYKNWTAIVNGDSIAPVFFQPKAKLQQQMDEGILVFEYPVGKKPDTLVYKDSFGPWGLQQIILNQ